MNNTIPHTIDAEVQLAESQDAMRAACMRALETLYRNVETDREDFDIAMHTLMQLWQAAQQASTNALPVPMLKQIALEEAHAAGHKSLFDPADWIIRAMKRAQQVQP